MHTKACFLGGEAGFAGIARAKRLGEHSLKLTRGTPSKKAPPPRCGEYFHSCFGYPPMTVGTTATELHASLVRLSCRGKACRQACSAAHQQRSRRSNVQQVLQTACRC